MSDDFAEPPILDPDRGDEIDVVINPDGSVTFRRLPPELLDLVRALDPDAVLACEVPANDEPTTP